MAAARALAEPVSEEELSPDYIIPAFDPRIAPTVVAAVAKAARDSVARI